LPCTREDRDTKQSSRLFPLDVVALNPDPRNPSARVRSGPKRQSIIPRSLHAMAAGLTSSFKLQVWKTPRRQRAPGHARRLVTSQTHRARRPSRQHVSPCIILVPSLTSLTSETGFLPPLFFPAPHSNDTPFCFNFNRSDKLPEARRNSHLIKNSFAAARSAEQLSFLHHPTKLWLCAAATYEVLPYAVMWANAYKPVRIQRVTRRKGPRGAPLLSPLPCMA
jgi:hypothetical protein